MTGAMTKGEREDLQRLIRQREKVLKSAARQRSTELLADFENQMGQEYCVRSGRGMGAARTRSPNAKFRKPRSRSPPAAASLGIPDRFAPGLSLTLVLGAATTTPSRSDERELRTMAETQIACDRGEGDHRNRNVVPRSARTLAIAGLASDAARRFFSSRRCRRSTR